MTVSRLLRAGIFWLPLLAVAQQPNNQAPPAPARDNNMTLNVVVNDKSGAPVSGLEEQQFTILDNKQPQKILSFAAITQSTPSHTPLEIIFIVDAVNIGFDRVAYERGELLKFLQRDNGKLAWPVSVDFFLDSGLQIQNEPSRDGNGIVSYLKQHQTGLRTNRRSEGFWGAAERTQLSIRTLQQLAAYEINRPGRKFVVWISPGWPLLSGVHVELTAKDQQGIFDTIVATSNQLRQAGITLYSVDPLGTTDAGGIRLVYYEQFLKGITAPKHAQYGNLGLQVLVAHTGGRVLNASNDIAGELERSVRDADSYYVLSYEPPAADGPHEYHAIEVKLTQSGLKAQTQTGYYAEPGPHAP